MVNYTASASATSQTDVFFINRPFNTITASYSCSASSNVSQQQAEQIAQKNAQQGSMNTVKNQAALISQTVNQSTLGETILPYSSTLLKEYITYTDNVYYLTKNLVISNGFSLQGYKGEKFVIEKDVTLTCIGKFAFISESDIVNNGTVIYDSGNQNQNSLSEASGQTSVDCTTVYAGTSYQNNGTMTINNTTTYCLNNSVCNFENSGTIVIESSGVFCILSGYVTNTGTIQNSGTLLLTTDNGYYGYIDNVGNNSISNAGIITSELYSNITFDYPSNYISNTNNAVINDYGCLNYVSNNNIQNDNSYYNIYLCNQYFVNNGYGTFENNTLTINTNFTSATFMNLVVDIDGSPYGSALEISNNCTLTNSCNITNNGTITIDTAGNITNDPSGIFVNQSGNIINNGTITNNSSLLYVNNNNIPLVGFTNYGTITNEIGGIITNNIDSIIFLEGTLNNYSTIYNYSNTNSTGYKITFTGITITGTITNELGSIIANNTDGIINIEGEIFNNGGTITNYNGTIKILGTITNENDANITNDTSGNIANNGTIQNIGSQITNEGNITNIGIFTNDNDSTITNNVTGNITNYGEINNDVSGNSINNYGIITNYNTIANIGIFTNYGTVYDNRTTTNDASGTITNTSNGIWYAGLENTNLSNYINYSIENEDYELFRTLSLPVTDYPFLNGLYISPKNLLIIDASGGIIIDGSSVILNDSGNIINNGTIENYGTVTDYGNTNNTSGTITNIGTGIWYIYPNSTYFNDYGTFSNNILTITNSTTIIQNWMTFYISIQYTIYISSNVTFINYGTIDNYGTVTDYGNTNNTSGTITNIGTGVWYIYPNSTYFIANNYGSYSSTTLTLQNNTIIQNWMTLNVATGYTINISTNVTFTNYGTIENYGGTVNDHGTTINTSYSITNTGNWYLFADTTYLTNFGTFSNNLLTITSSPSIPDWVNYFTVVSGYNVSIGTSTDNNVTFEFVGIIENFGNNFQNYGTIDCTELINYTNGSTNTIFYNYGNIYVG